MANIASKKLKGLKLRRVEGVGGPSKAQRDWVSKLASLGGDGGDAGGGEVAIGGDPVVKGSGGEETKKDRRLNADQMQLLNDSVKKGILPAIPGIPGGEIPGKVIDVLLGERSAQVRVRNNTQQALVLDPLSLREVDNEKQIGISHGKYNSLPPDEISPGQGAEFLSSSNSILGLTTTGAEARIRYFLADRSAGWVIHFDNSPFQKAKGDALAEGPNAGQFVAPPPVINDATNAVFAFEFKPKGGTTPPGPGPVPPGPGPVPPGPTPTGPDIAASCMITVKNNTQQPLTLTDQGHERGDFMTFPPATLAPGASGQFVSIETPQAKDDGCKGFLVYQVGTPMAAVWRVEWDNPEGQKNTANSTLNPQGAGFSALEQVGQGEENVPINFTLSGGGAPGPVPPVPPVPPIDPPVDPPVDPPPVEPDFVPPPESKQPTLRKGDKSADDWVEYMQFLLRQSLGLDKNSLPSSGDFDAKTHAAVIKFQKQNGLLVDGVVGNQTWAALREDKPEAPSTDGRKPHTFVEKGAEARWTIESEFNNAYDADKDSFLLAVDTVGDTPIEKAEATVRITPPDTKPKVVKVPLVFVPAKKFFKVQIDKFKKTFPAKDPKAAITDYLVEAYLPKDLGGDFYSAKIRESKISV